MTDKIYAFSRRTVEALRRAMQVLLRESGAKSTLIIDRSGYVVCSSGTFSSMRARDLGVMAAATFTALRTMVDVADSEELSIRFHSRNVEKIFFAVLNERTFLMVLYDTTTAGRRVREAARAFVQSVRRSLTAQRRARKQMKPIPSLAKDFERIFRRKTRY